MSALTFLQYKVVVYHALFGMGKAFPALFNSQGDVERRAQQKTLGHGAKPFPAVKSGSDDEMGKPAPFKEELYRWSCIFCSK